MWSRGGERDIGTLIDPTWTNQKTAHDQSAPNQIIFSRGTLISQ